jgi:putative chitinase
MPCLDPRLLGGRGAVVPAADVMSALVLGGLMGVVGQGARAIVGLKKLNDENAAKAPNEQDAFIASRLLVSLFIGFVAGVVAAIALGLDKIANIALGDLQILLGIAAAGYAGTDVIEAFLARLPQAGSTGAGATDAAKRSQRAAPVVLVTSPEQIGDIAGLARAVTDLHGEMQALRRAVSDLPPEETAVAAASGDVFDTVTPEQVKQLFAPETPLGNIRKHLPSIIAGLRQKGLVDRPMLRMALGTIRAETEGFVPISEFVSTFNTAQQPFDLYEPGTPAGKKLGNTKPGDGAKFKGRGFVQLTGRDNYTRIGTQLNIDLIASPEQANESKTAGLILAQFLANREKPIREALAQNDLKTARRLVNGGSHGFTRFKAAYDIGEEVFPDTRSIEA